MSHPLSRKQTTPRTGPRSCGPRPMPWAWSAGPTSAPAPSIFRESMPSTPWISGPPAPSANPRMPNITSRSLTIRRQCAWRSLAKGASGGAPQHTIQTVREKYAWNESEIGAGLEPGKGTATPAMADLKDRLLQLWILPYGVVKAAIAAGDKTKCPPRTGPP